MNDNILHTSVKVICGAAVADKCPTVTGCSISTFMGRAGTLDSVGYRLSLGRFAGPDFITFQIKFIAAAA